MNETPERTAATSALARRLAATGLFPGVDGPCLAQLAARAVLRRARGGEYLWRTGDRARNLMAVEQGLVAVARPGEDGETNLVALFGPGDSLCITPALEGLAFPADAVAVTRQVVLLCVPAAVVQQLQPQHPELAPALNRVLIEHTRILRAKIDIVSAPTAPRRLAMVLFHLAHRFGTRRADGALTTGVHLTRAQLGHLVNARTETVIRILSRWQKAGWIRTTGHGFELVQADMLERIAAPGPHGR
ncbi:MAG: Crp/Fnr family transcriptional regulator [Gammaproteobacteria bacterium]|nr:Crp/Fnr family transcriptional regulator [Gammaproteobacteria bacterium]